MRDITTAAATTTATVAAAAVADVILRGPTYLRSWSNYCCRAATAGQTIDLMTCCICLLINFNCHLS